MGKRIALDEPSTDNVATDQDVSSNLPALPATAPPGLLAASSAAEIHRIRMGQVLRDARPKSATPDHHDGYANLYAATHSDGSKLVPFESGINPLAQVKAVDGPRRPAILIASSPHKIGMTVTPWQDHFDPDNGYVRYYGDNRTPGANPATKPGNRALLAAFEQYGHHQRALREQAPPLLLFRRVPQGGIAKGFAQFEGLAIIASVELVSQYNATLGGTFANYAYDLLVLDLTHEYEALDFRWINRRRDPILTDEHANLTAPSAWRKWLADGAPALTGVRRRVSKLLIEGKNSQVPVPGSKEAQILKEIYSFYDGKKARFETLAQLIAERVISVRDGDYLVGGLTRATGDGGIDFVARLDVGAGFGRAKLIVLGQAKCEKPDTPTNGNHVARTVARLRRGWLGVYVTTSYFSAQVQREVIEDRYPVVLITGRRVAEEVRKILLERDSDDLGAFLQEVDATHTAELTPRDPEELLTR